MRLPRPAAAAIAAATAALSLLAVGVPAAATRPTAGRYRLIDLGTLGGQNSFATAMNDHGVVVGSSTVADGSFHGFRWRRGVMTDLGALRPTDVNNRGQIVGTKDVADGQRAYLWTRGRLTDLGHLGGGWTHPTALNDRGQVVGVSSTADGQTRPFLWTRGRIRPLPLDTVAGINNRGQVAGGAFLGAGFHAALWQRGKVVDLGALAFDRSNTYGINNRGWVIGWAFSPRQDERGMLWRNATMTDIGTLGGDSTHLIAINDRGHLLGVSDDGTGADRPVLWRRGTLTDLIPLGVDADGDLVDLNDRGDIAASIRPVFGTAHAALYRRVR